MEHEALVWWSVGLSVTKWTCNWQLEFKDEDQVSLRSYTVMTSLARFSQAEMVQRRWGCFPNVFHWETFTRLALMTSSHRFTLGFTQKWRGHELKQGLKQNLSGQGFQNEQSTKIPFENLWTIERLRFRCLTECHHWPNKENEQGFL